MKKFIVALIFVALNLYAYRYFAGEDFRPQRETFEDFPLTLDQWHCTATEEMSEEVLGALGVTDYLLCNFFNESDERWANVYVGYHASQTRGLDGSETLIHPPEHCLPGSGWDIIESDVVPIDFGAAGEARRVIIARGNQRNLVYFWYQSRGRIIAGNLERALFMFVDRAFAKRTDGSLVRFTVPILYGDELAAEETFRSIANEITSQLDGYIPN